MTDLSPQAQAVLDAFTGNDTIHGLHLMTPRLAAAFRAAANQVAPDEPYPEDSQFWDDDEAIQEWHNKQYFHKQNFAIANELEGVNG